MLSKDSLKTERHPSPVDDSNWAVIGDGGEKKKHQVAGVTGDKTRVEQAEMILQREVP
jgi:hypothetical protein